MSDEPGGRVECYSGHTYAGEPRAVVWGGRRLRVVRIQARWRTPAGPVFAVEVEGDHHFELSYHEGEDRWTVRERAA